MTPSAKAHFDAYGRPPRVGDLYEDGGAPYRVASVDPATGSWTSASVFPPKAQTTVNVNVPVGAVQAFLFGALGVEVFLLLLVLGHALFVGLT